jgi:hypothetical protein
MACPKGNPGYFARAHCLKARLRRAKKHGLNKSAARGVLFEICTARPPFLPLPRFPRRPFQDAPGDLPCSHLSLLSLWTKMEHTKELQQLWHSNQEKSLTN